MNSRDMSIYENLFGMVVITFITILFNSENLKEILNLITNNNEGDTLEKLYTEPKYGISHYYYSKEVKDIITKILKKETLLRKFIEIKNNTGKSKKDIYKQIEELTVILQTVNWELYQETRKEELEKIKSYFETGKNVSDEVINLNKVKPKSNSRKIVEKSKINYFPNRLIRKS